MREPSLQNATTIGLQVFEMVQQMEEAGAEPFHPVEVALGLASAAGAAYAKQVSWTDPALDDLIVKSMAEAFLGSMIAGRQPAS